MKSRASEISADGYVIPIISQTLILIARLSLHLDQVGNFRATSAGAFLLNSGKSVVPGCFACPFICDTEEVAGTELWCSA
jgi:hypothetical protein